MKKFIKYLGIILCVTLVVGCGAKEKEDEKLPTNLVESIQIDTTGAAAVCTAEYDYSDTQGYATGSKFAVFTDDNDIVIKVVTQEVVVSNDKDLLAIFQDSLERNYSTFSQYGGYDYNIKIEGNKLTSSVTIDYTETDLKTMADDNEALKVYLNEDNKFTLSSVKAMYISSGAECN